MTFDVVFALIGFLGMVAILVGIGINQPRGTSVKMWCYGYLTISVVFDLLVVIAIVYASQLVWLTNLLLGTSAGAATGLGIHVAHHISEEEEHETANNGDKTGKSPFGF